MGSKPKYVIVSAMYDGVLAAKVNKLIEDGYVPTGGVAISDGGQTVLAQAMVRIGPRYGHGNEDRDRQMKALREALGLGPDDNLMEAMLRLAQERSTEPEEGDKEDRPDPFVESLRKTLGLGEGDDLEETIRAREKRLNELEEAARTREIEAFIERETAELKYPDRLLERLVAAVKAAEPKTIEEAKSILSAKREEYDALMAELELIAKGYHDVEVKGPVLERELGVPEFARGAHLLTEAMVRSGDGTPRRWNRAGVVHHAPIVRPHGTGDQVEGIFERQMGGVFILSGQPAVASDIRVENRSEFSGQSLIRSHAPHPSRINPDILTLNAGLGQR